MSCLVVKEKGYCHASIKAFVKINFLIWMLRWLFFNFKYIKAKLAVKKIASLWIIFEYYDFAFYSCNDYF